MNRLFGSENSFESHWYDSSASDSDITGCEWFKFTTHSVPQNEFKVMGKVEKFVIR